MEESTAIIALLFFGLLLAAIFSGLWIFLGLAAVSIVVYVGFYGGALSGITMLVYNSLNSYYLLAMPFFILMGELLIQGGVATRLYDAISPLMRNVPGGLIHATVVGNVLLGAACGSTVAATSAMSAVAVPELKRLGYAPGVSYGSLASAGCLAALIPPSMGFIVYSALTGTPMASLFMAGIVPGLILAFFLSLVTGIINAVRPHYFPKARKERILWGKAILNALRKLAPLLALVIVVLGSIYGGFATPAEAGCVGVVGGFIFSFKNLNWEKFRISLYSTLRISSALIILIGFAATYGFVLNSMGVTEWLRNVLSGLPGGPEAKMFWLFGIFLVLGMFLDGGSMCILTVPIFLPFVVSVGYDPLWYGVFFILCAELGNITPPVGMTLFVVQAISKERFEVIARGALPYWTTMTAVIIMIIFVPQVARMLV